MRITATLLLFAISAAAYAHHSRSHYPQETRELAGELVAVHWANPHVGFTLKVANDEGEEAIWRVEGYGNVFSLERGGTTRDMFTVGEQVKALGSVSVRRELDMLASNLLLADGTEILLNRAAKPYWSTQTIGYFDPTEAESRPVDALNENLGVFRVWSAVANGIGQTRHFPFTEEAIAGRAAWNEVDNFAERCEPEGMPRIMTNPHPFEFVNRSAEISLISELYDLVRTIHMDESGPPADEPASPLGYSVGRWDGDVLVVATTLINWPYFDNIGTPQSESVQMLERFTVSEDQTRLDYELTVTDPGTFAEPAVYRRYWLALGEEVRLYDCRVHWEPRR